MEGHVKFAWDNLRKQNIVSVVPPLKYGDICTHKALEARAHNHLDRAMGFLGQAKFAYRLIFLDRGFCFCLYGEHHKIV